MFDLATIRVLQGRKTEPGNLALNGSRSCPGVCCGTKPWTGNRSFRATDKETSVQTPVHVHTILTTAVLRRRCPAGWGGGTRGGQGARSARQSSLPLVVARPPGGARTTTHWLRRDSDSRESQASGPRPGHDRAIGAVMWGGGAPRPSGSGFLSGRPSDLGHRSTDQPALVPINVVRRPSDDRLGIYPL